MVRWKRYPRASEVRARQFPSIGGFRRPDTVPSVLQYIVSFGPYFREPPDFSKISAKYFLWNVIIPLKISLQKSYGTLGFQRTKVTPLRDTAKFQKIQGVTPIIISPCRRHPTYSPGAWSLLDQERARLATSLLCSNMKRTSIQN